MSSRFSARYGASYPRDLLARAAEGGIGTVALTDRDMVTGTVYFVKAAAAAGVKPVFGGGLSFGVSVAWWSPGAIGLSEVPRETGLNWRTVSEYLSADSSAPPRRVVSGQPRKRVVDEVASLIDTMLRAEVVMKAAVVHERLAT